MKQNGLSLARGICRIHKMFSSTMLGNVFTRDLVTRPHKHSIIGLRGWFSALCSSYDHTSFRKKPPIKDGDGRILKNINHVWQHNAW